MKLSSFLDWVGGLVSLLVSYAVIRWLAGDDVQMQNIIMYGALFMFLYMIELKVDKVLKELR